MIIDNVVVEADETVFTADELKKYVEYAKAHSDGVLKKNPNKTLRRRKS